MHIHQEVLEAANRIAGSRSDWTFTPDEVVRALPHLNVSSVRTHVVSRCCVNSPKNHLHRWRYFKRVGRGLYEVLPSVRRLPKALGKEENESPKSKKPRLRDTVHVVVSKDNDTYVAECVELAVVTQGLSLDELVNNVREAVALHLEDEDSAALGLDAHPRMQLIYDMPRAV